MRGGVLLVVLIFFVVLAQIASAERKSVFLVLNSKDIMPTEGFLWEFAENTKPAFSRELAIGKFVGCAVVSFIVSDSGRTTKIKVDNTMPEGRQARLINKVMRKVRWQPVAEGASPGEEQRLMRLDFCMSEDSNEAAEVFCDKLAKVPCE